MPYALVFNMPMKTGLKLMTPVGSDCANPERKPFYHVVDELDCTSLISSTAVYWYRFTILP
jgi:hypothetical protein